LNTTSRVNRKGNTIWHFDEASVKVKLQLTGWDLKKAASNSGTDIDSNKKLSYPQRKRASNMAILYGADGISIWNRLGVDNECDRQTAYVRLVAPSVESIQNTKFDTRQR